MKNIVLMAGVMACLGMASYAKAAGSPSGTCGTNCNWTIENGTLKITGGVNGEIGTMDDYSQHPIGDGIWETDNTPWKNYVVDITSVDVKGIRNIGSGAFTDIGHKGVSINLDDTIEKIGYLSGTIISDNKLPAQLKILDGWAISGSFAGEPYLELPDSLREIRQGALYNIKVPVIIPDSIEAIANDGVYSAFGSGENLQIICRGTEESCKNVQQLFSLYCPLGGNGCRKESDFIDLSSKVILADSSNCNSTNYYWNGEQCLREKNPDNRFCIGGYAKLKDRCVDPLKTFAKKRYTPAEAVQWLKDDDNTVILTFRK